MRFQGRLARDGKYWFAEIPAFDALTQGRSKRAALAMAEDLVQTMVDARGFRAVAQVTGNTTFEIESDRVDLLVALLLRRQREREGLTLADVAARLGQRSNNAYARYEQGRAMPTVAKLEELLRAVAPKRRIVWDLVA